jgi:hypothetical protein
MFMAKKKITKKKTVKKSIQKTTQKKVAQKALAPKVGGVCDSYCCAKCNWWAWIVPEVAIYFFFYSLLVALGSQVNVWLISLALVALINIAVLACPMFRSVCKR